MGHKRKRMRYEDAEQVITISIEHPENNPQGVTVEEVEIPPKQPFGINVGQQVEDLLKASNETAKEETQEEQTMKEETKETTVNENINSNKQEESKMKEEAKETTTNETAKQAQEEQDIPNPNRKIEPDKPGSIIDREAAAHAVRGICYGAGVVVGMTVTSCLIYGIKQLISGDRNEQTTETLSKLI